MTTAYCITPFFSLFDTVKMGSSVCHTAQRDTMKDSEGNNLNNQHFIACLECSSVIATDYNRVVCIRQTRNDEEVTDWWKWWAIIFLYKKKKTQEKETTEYIFKEKKEKEKEKLLQDESTMTAPPLHLEKNKVWCKRGRKRGKGRQRAGWLVMNETMAF